MEWLWYGDIKWTLCPLFSKLENGALTSLTGKTWMRGLGDETGDMDSKSPCVTHVAFRSVYRFRKILRGVE